LWHVEELRKQSGRQVFVHGVTDLQLSEWQQLADPKRWHELPEGSIVVIDEAWKAFPKRPTGGAVPPYVQELATHRHRGFDLFLVTQHPANQLDHFVRGLVGRHYHLRRVFGSARSRLYTWERLGDYLQWQDRKEAVVEWFKFPRQVFTWYKSAEVHTVRRQVPWKPFALMGGGVLAVGLLGFLAYRSMTGGAAELAGVGNANAARADQGPRAGLRVGGGRFDATDFLPVVAGQPFTAPVYQDDVTFEDVPRVAGCGVLKIGRRVTCRCDDQQGNQVQLEYRHCLAIFEAGQFQPGEAPRYPVIPPYVPELPGPATGETPGQDASRPAGGSGSRRESAGQEG
jgi:hypothetical protein